MTRLYSSAGAIVVSSDLHRPRMLLLEQIRTTGERQVVAPKGRIEPGESPLIAAAREVSEEAGLHDMRYVAYLGQEAYRFTDHDGTPARKTVDWFLFAATDTTATARQSEGFVAAQWHDLPDALTAASHASFHKYVRRADEIIAWRRSGPLDYSEALSQAVWGFSRQANALLAKHPGAGAALCGSGARGDFIDGWSDLDLIAWGLEPASPAALALRQLADEVSHQTGIRISLRLARSDDANADGIKRLHAMKLRAVLRRTHIDVPIVAGTPTASLPEVPHTADLAADIGHLLDFAHQRQAAIPTTDTDRADCARRTLAVLSSAARQTVLTIGTHGLLRLPDVVVTLDQHWPGTEAARLLDDYDAFRRTGAADLIRAEQLASQVPAALEELHQLAAARDGRRTTIQAT
ncbi:NUDIX domain-containing protein [Verrucosispora sp. WMMC514]|uniref:NUDIX domain-containing protein n=1 Tax=Verrucosispora sp. WMMC514 TaxID=3015156 RepID=UPI00248CCDAD|nr:NUDIX domain-containing protein [Verrucosispora sp. WMMC514]WBB92112.1 NUDIX domain-containing protein [Verrucosispora sp. WMMC514]